MYFYLTWKLRILKQKAQMKANKTQKLTRTTATGPMKSNLKPK